MPTKVYLIGTNHFDIKGPERLSKLLEIYMPDAIVGEGGETVRPIPESKQNLSIEELMTDFKGRNQEYTGNVELAVRIAVALGYEGYIVEDYSKKYGIPVIKKDDFSGCQDLIEGVNNVVKGGDISQIFNIVLTPEEFVSGVDAMYPQDNEALNDGHGANREKLWEAEIRKQPGVVVGIFGVRHLYSKHHNLYNRISDLTAERIMLCDADKI